MEFLNKLRAAWAKNNSLLCIGLDPDFDKLPEKFKNSTTPLWDFNCAIIDATADLVCSFKPNSAFYESRGAEGIEDLKRTCDYLHEKHPDTPIVLDFKRGDIGNTNEHYAAFAFGYLGVDAVTVHPWSGREGMQAFLDCKERGIIVWCKGSNPGSDEFQDVSVDGNKLYMKVAKNVVNDWNSNGNCLLVVGATYPSELSEVRQAVGDNMTILMPGIGAQGADIKASVEAGINQQGNGLIISTSRAVLYASDGANFADDARQAATDLRNEINKYRGA